MNPQNKNILSFLFERQTDRQRLCLTLGPNNQNLKDLCVFLTKVKGSKEQSLAGTKKDLAIVKDLGLSLAKRIGSDKHGLTKIWTKRPRSYQRLGQ